MSASNNTAATRADSAFVALRRPQGVSAAKVQEIAGWARKPTAFDLEAFAARRGCKLVVRESAKVGRVFRFANA